MALTDIAQNAISEHFSNLDLRESSAVDATCGNGWDTVFLGKLGFEQVLAFDIQDAAISATQQRVQAENLKNITLIKDDHQNIERHTQSPVRCFMFNFGYLPGANKQLTTKTNTSLAALNCAANLIETGGIISALCYPGHGEGLAEARAIEYWSSNLNKNWDVQKVQSVSATERTPFLLLLKIY